MRPGVYVMIGCLFGIVALCFLKETAGASLAGTDVPESEPEEYGVEAITAWAQALEGCGR